MPDHENASAALVQVAEGRLAVRLCRGDHDVLDLDLSDLPRALANRAALDEVCMVIPTSLPRG